MTIGSDIDVDISGDYVPIANPIFSPLLSTIVTTRYLIRQTVIGTIHWNDCDIIRFTYATFIHAEPGSSFPFQPWYDIRTPIAHLPSYPSEYRI